MKIISRIFPNTRVEINIVHVIYIVLFSLISIKGLAQPVANFTVSSTSVCSGSSITFTDNTTNIIGIPSYTWAFGTGATPSGASDAGPHTVTYSGSGIVIASLDVKDDVGTSHFELPITVNPIPTITGVTPGSACGSGTVTLGATASAGTINWYLASTGGSSLGTGPSFTTPSIIVTTTYYVDATSNGCTTGSRTPVVATVNPIPTITGVTPGSVCGPGTVTLGATASAGTINWYSASTGGSSLGTGLSFTTPSIIVTTTYYVDATSNGCTTGSRTPVVATVNPVPTITGVTPGSVCGPGTVTLGATASAGTIHWYSASTGGSSLGTGPSFTTPSIIVTTTYYVDATSNGCTTGSRTPVVATVNPIPTITGVTPGSVCGPGTVTLGATASAGTINWYSASTGGSSLGTGLSFTTPSIIVTTTYYVDATSNGCTTGSRTPVIATVNPVPTITGVTPGSVCGSGTVTLGATASAGTINWYSASTGGSSLGTGPSFTTPSISVTTNYYASATSGTCSSVPRTAVLATVIPLPVPTLTSSDANNRFCAGTSVTFTAGGGGVGSTYDFKVNGVTLQTGSLSTYTTSSITNGQIVSVVVTNVAGCSATSAGILNIVDPEPTISIAIQPACSVDYHTYSLTVAITPGATLISTAGMVADNGGGIWSITNIPAGTTITLTATTNRGCITTREVPAPNCDCPVIQPPVSGGDISYCSTGIIPALTVTVSTGETADWYNAASGGTPLRSGSLSYTPTAAGIYYAEARNITSNCTSGTRTAITLTMNPIPVPTLTSSDADNIFCAGTSVTFTAGGGTNYNFRVAGASVQNGISNVYTTNSLTNGQVVNVIVTNAAGCSATSPSITNTVHSLPVPVLTSSDPDNIICNGTPVTFTSGNGTNYNFRINGVSVQNSAAPVYLTSSLTNGQVVNVIVTDGNGCVNTSVNITNTIIPAPTPTLSSSDADNIFCSGTGITFTAGGGNSYNFRVGGTSVQSGALPTYLTSTLSNGQIVDVVVTGANGCSAISQGITNTVYPQPVADAGTGGNSCDMSFELNAVPSIGLGTWTMASGPGTATFAPNANSPNAVVTVSDYGTYSFRWTEVSGQCSSSATVNVIFYLNPVADAGTGGNNCGLTFRFNASLNTGVGTWAKVSGPGNVTFSPDPNSPNAAVTVSDFGTYTFSWTVVNGICMNSSNVTVRFIQQASANGGTGGDACGKSFKLSAVETIGTGSWTQVDGPGTAEFVPDSTQADAEVTVDEFGEYNFAWTVVNSTCSSSEVVNVVFHDVPPVNAGRDTVVCKGGTVQLQAQGDGSFSWIPAEPVDNPSVGNPVVNPDTTTTFHVSLTDQYGCINTDSIVVEVREDPVADAGPDQQLWFTFATNLDASLKHNYETGVWSVMSGTGIFADTTDTKTGVSEISIGDNRYIWSVSNGYCPLSHDTVLIVVNNFIVPTLITPNMDGRNDYFVIKGLEALGKTELDIFDRRGLIVYRNTDYDNSWNGVDNNNDFLPDDTYFYVLKTGIGKSVSGYIVIRH